MKVAGFWSLVLAGALAASVVLAGSSGKLTGTVTDDKGQPLPGAAVSVESPVLIGGPRTAVTDARGVFGFPALDPGRYAVKVELQGFLTQEHTAVQVRLDHTTEVEVRMPAASFGEEVTVVANTAVVDPAQSGTGQTFTPDFLNRMAVGSANRDYTSVLSWAGGSVDDGNGNPRVFGSTSGENSYLIDGLETTDPVVAQWGTSFVFDAIQEISFQTGGFEAEYGRATGGVVNVVTKSGGNGFSGTFDLRYHTEKFYTSGTHFDASKRKIKYLDPALTLGGPIVRDKLWFFVSGEKIESDYTPYRSPTTEKWKGTLYLGKATWQASQNWRLTAKLSGNPTDIDNANADQFNLPEANYFQRQSSDIYQLEVAGVLSQNALFSAQAGYYRGTLNSYPQSGDLAAVGHVNNTTGYAYGGYPNAQYSDRNRDDYLATLTWFKDGLAGSHEFKGGVELSRLAFSGSNFTTGGGYSYVDDYDGGDIPFLMNYQGNPGTLHYKGDNSSAYLQDGWKPSRNLTLKLGVRYDTVSYKNDVGSKVADMGKVQPRLGFAWDVTGDGKTSVKGSWGRFMHPSALSLPETARVNNMPSEEYLSCGWYLGVADPSVCQAWAARHGRRWSAGPDAWDPAGWFLYETFTSEPNRIARGLRPTYADEWNIGIERQVAARTSLGVSYVKKVTKDIFEDTCNGNVPAPTAGGDCSYYVMENIPGLGRDYQGVVLNLESRATEWFHLLANYTWSKSRGNVEYTQNAGSDFDIYPELWQNRYGYLSDDRRHRVKVSGYFLLPHQFTVGLTGSWSSAFAYNLLTNNGDPAYQDLAYGTVYLASRGSFRANSTYQVDAQVSKAFKVSGMRLEAIVAVNNVFNSQRPTPGYASAGVCEYRLGCGGYAWGQPTNWQTPRRYEAGFRIEF